MNTRQYLAEATLLDGRPAVLRSIRPDDKDTLRTEFEKLKHRDVYQRFFYPKSELTEEELAFLTEVDFVKHVALVAGVVSNGLEHPAGVARFIALGEEPGTADIAFTIVEQFQGLGLATLFLQHLANIARSLDYRHFTADVLATNASMLDVFANSGMPMQVSTRRGITNIRLSLQPGNLTF